MKLLFDQNLSFKLCLRLKDLFPDSQQVRLLGMSDSDVREIWQHCSANDFVVVTQDSDFADMAAVLGPPPKVVWLRCGNQPTSGIERLLRDHFQVIETFADDETATCLEIYWRPINHNASISASGISGTWLKLTPVAFSIAFKIAEAAPSIQFPLRLLGRTRMASRYSRNAPARDQRTRSQQCFS